MQKIDKRKNYYLMLDTETTNGLDNPIAYDIGFAIVDKSENVYVSRSYVVKEMWDDHFDMLQNAYYAEKLPNYTRELCLGIRKKEKLYNIRKEIQELYELYDVKAMVAHNARFDNRALRNTQKFLTDGKYVTFLPYGLDVWDTLQMARDTICKQKLYVKFCEENGYMTNQSVPQVRATAEILYRYLTGDNEFQESHTGLEDVLIEKAIFNRCLRQHKKMRKSIFGKC